MTRHVAPAMRCDVWGLGKVAGPPHLSTVNRLLLSPTYRQLCRFLPGFSV